MTDPCAKCEILPCAPSKVRGGWCSCNDCARHLALRVAKLERLIVAGVQSHEKGDTGAAWLRLETAAARIAKRGKGKP